MRQADEWRETWAIASCRVCGTHQPSSYIQRCQRDENDTGNGEWKAKMPTALPVVCIVTLLIAGVKQLLADDARDFIQEPMGLSTVDSVTTDGRC